MSKVTSIVFAGLGGQGILTASDIFAEVAFRSGVDVKKSEIHGMSQRGGSVTTEARFGKKVLSPMVPTGEADYLVVFEPSQIENNLWALRQGGTIIETSLIDNRKLANKRAINIALLGVLSTCLAFDRQVWIQAIKTHLPPALHAANLAAFDLGVEAGRQPKKEIGHA